MAAMKTISLPSIRALAVCVALSFVAACPAESRAAITLSHVRVEQRGSDEPAAFCANFTLSPEQVRQFFSRSAELPATAYHDLDYLPCYVKGSARMHGKKVRWEIRAGGTAEIAVDGGKTRLFGCRNCDDLLK
jgi:hypothetical protein